MAHACNSSYSEGQGRIAWAQEFEVTVSSDYTTALKPEWQSETLSLEKKIIFIYIHTHTHTFRWFGPRCSSGGDEKWWTSGYILKVEPTEFPGESDRGCEEKPIMTPRFFNFSKQRTDLLLTKIERGEGRNWGVQYWTYKIKMHGARHSDSNW